MSPEEWMGNVSQKDTSHQVAWLSPPRRAWGPTQTNISNLPNHQRVSHPWHSPATSCHRVPNKCGERVSVESRIVEKEGAVRRKTEAVPSGSEKEYKSLCSILRGGARPCYLRLPFLPQRLDRSCSARRPLHPPPSSRYVHQSSDHTPPRRQLLASGPRRVKCLCAGEE